jgi:hypothetical protein
MRLRVGGDFFQADEWGRLPVTQEVAGSSSTLYFFRRFCVTGRSDKFLLKSEALERVSAARTQGGADSEINMIAGSVIGVMTPPVFAMRGDLQFVAFRIFHDRSAI